MAKVMELSQETLESIGAYIRRNLPDWLAEIREPTLRERELELRERTVRIEEELKTQQELMRQGFAQSDKRFEELRADMLDRFEQVDKRFEQVDKRFEEHRQDMFARFDDLQRQSTRTMTILSVMIGLIGVLVAVSNFVG